MRIYHYYKKLQKTRYDLKNLFEKWSSAIFNGFLIGAISLGNEGLERTDKLSTMNWKQ